MIVATGAELFCVRSIAIGAGLPCLLIALAASGCATVNAPQDAWLGRDKAQHFALAGALAAGATAAAQSAGLSDGEALFVAIPLTLSFGVGKEFYDREVRHTYFSWTDLCWDLLGAVTGSLLVAGAD